MGILATCPECGFESPDIRCPRCNALKVRGCSGVCSACASSCDTGAGPATCEAVPSDAPRPSDDAPEDTGHPGTPLER